jgi:hypothetical protein
VPATYITGSDETRFPDLADPEVAPIKTKLALAYLDHKADLSVDSDQEIVDRVDDITAILFGLTLRATRGSDHYWIARFAWFGEIVDELHDELGAADRARIVVAPLILALLGALVAREVIKAPAASSSGESGLSGSKPPAAAGR